MCTALGAVAAPFVVWSVAPWISPLWALPGIPLAVVTATFGMIGYTRRHRARIKRTVMAASGRACVGCVYNLGGLGDTGACPECGRRFNIAADRRSWQRVGMYEERARCIADCAATVTGRAKARCASLRAIK
ncbi:MAG: hypothetical protein ACKVS9_09660 [Phycisphaerae bacterium]